MKINGEFVLRKIEDDYILVPVGITAVEFSGMAVLNETGSIIWDSLSKGESKEAIIKILADEYEESTEAIDNDYNEFVSYLLSKNILKL